MVGHVNDDDDVSCSMPSSCGNDEYGQQQQHQHQKQQQQFIEEEVWEASPGMGFALQSQCEIHTVDCGLGKSLRYMSISDSGMTPLDMIYDGHTKSNGTTAGMNKTTKGTNKDDYDEFYDGTGNLMWTAALYFAHLVAQDVGCLRKYLHRYSPASSSTTTTSAIGQHRICELGCGTGGAGISLLLFSSSSSSSAASTAFSNFHHHLVFTDNDMESLDLCKRNCELNELNPSSYSQHLLSWGEVDEGNTNDDVASGGCPNEWEKHSFDTVLATDVVYDIKMIPPMLQSVEYLLKKDGYLILSHVPRFCLPKEGKEERNREMIVTSIEATTTEIDGRPRPYVELERHIQEEASKIGLAVVETIRPEIFLKEGTTQSFEVDEYKDAHAVVFVFGRASC
jgi:2-polyprenyl-3-methyl-5-hydroxy-6-metoxy-1,4-benzoquinol methylase